MLDPEKFLKATRPVLLGRGIRAQLPLVRETRRLAPAGAGMGPGKTVAQSVEKRSCRFSRKGNPALT